MEAREIYNLITTKYKKYLDNDDIEGLLFDAPRNIRPEIASFLLYDASIDVWNQITEIPDYMLKGCQKVDTVVIPKHIKKIGNNAFEGSSIKKFKIEDGSTIEAIPAYCFKGCSSLNTVIFPISVKEVQWGAFDGCDSLSKVVTPRRQKRADKFRGFGDTATRFKSILSDREDD